MPHLSNREVVLVKEEVTYNVDSSPVAASDAVLVGNASWAHEGLRMIERNVVKNTDPSKQQVFGDTLKTVSFDVELKGSGTAGTAPEFEPLLEACGFVPTVVPATSVSYSPSSTATDKKSVTIYYYQDGLLHVLTGCRGTVSFNLETGAIGMATFTMTGHSSAPTDASLPNPTLQSTVPYAIRGGAFSIDGFSATINALTVDMAIAVITPPDMSASDGFGEVFLGRRDPNGSFDPEAELVADENFYGNFRSGAQMALTTGVIGDTAGNRYQIDMDQVYYRDASPGDRDGIRTYELAFGAIETSGDDEIELIFT